jgi:tetratricopeptide (TPR) repeat protein
MGRCLSKEKSSKKETLKLKRDELVVQVQSQDTPLNDLRPRKNNENIETQIDSSLQRSVAQSDLSLQTSSLKSGAHNRNASKISIDFDQISKLKIEQEMLIRIGKSLHELAICYQTQGNYLNSVELLQLAGEIYMHLSLYSDFNMAMADLLIAYIANQSLQRKMPIVIEPLDERTQIVCSTFKYLNGQGKDMFVTKYNIEDFDSLVSAVKEFQNPKLGKSSLVDALMDLAHLFRIWLISPAESLNLYQEAENIEPHNPEIKFYKALSYRALGKIDLAIENYLKGIDKDPNFADCYFNLGNIYLEEKENLKDAEDCYTKALIGCNNGHQGLVSIGKICEMLSEVHLCQENPTKALKILFKGIESDFLYIENYNKASKLTRLMEYYNISSLLAMVTMILSDQPIGDFPETVEKDMIDYKNILFDAIGKLLHFINKIPKMDKMTKSDRISFKKYFNKITSDQITKLKEFYSVFEKI